MSLQRFVERLIWLCMVPLIILGSLLLGLHLQALSERRQILADSVLRTVARHVDQMLEVRLASLQLLGRMLTEASTQQAGKFDVHAAHRMARHFANLHGHHVIISNDHHEMLVNTRVPPSEPIPAIPQLQGHSAVTAALSSNEPAVGDPFFDPIAAKRMVAVAVPLQIDARHRLLLLTMIETGQLRDRLQPFKLPDGWQLRLRDSMGREFAHPDDSEWATGGNVSAAAAHSGGRSGSVNPGQDNWRETSLARAPWTVALAAPAFSALDEPLIQALLFLSTLLATVGAAYWGGRIAGRRLIDAMVSLTRAVKPPPASRDIDEVAAVRGELRRLWRRREAVQDAERRRIGLELHDDLQQKLALIQQDLNGLRSHLVHGDAPASELTEVLNRARQLVGETIDSTRRLVHDLRPPGLEDLGLPAALQVLAERHCQTFGHSVDLEVNESERWADLPFETAAALYRVVQEALNNIRKHSNAAAVDLSLEIDERGQLTLEISDDGDGFDPVGVTSWSAGIGLRGMHERIQSLSGSLEVISQPGQGTALVIKVPLTASASSADGPQAAAL